MLLLDSSVCGLFKWRQFEPEVILLAVGCRKAVSQRQQEYIKRKMAEDPTYRVKMICQIHWKSRCRRAGVHYSKGFLELLGCSWDEFVRYLEHRFKRGMTFSNYGEAWHLDHILPTSAFDLRKAEERAMCCCWINLRPLAADTNRRKQGSYSKDELRAYKTLWKIRYGRKPRQLKFSEPF